ncbi:adenine deaminase [Desulfatiglans anilini]|uniref:adenine deaminase n=1 Tax=Desulfatiglans anilini TaxID=90728 RepID=UPI00042336B2|nr:adenine deaminase [Desulfatiglans anilini]
MNERIELQRRRIAAARGDIPADLVLRGGSVVNVFSGGVDVRDLAVKDGVIVGLGEGLRGVEERDVSGDFLLPGFIEGHLHVESSMMMPRSLAAALIPNGTTALVSDPHEIANVLGMDGIRLMLEDSSCGIPFDFFFMAPSCVPATHMETSGAALHPGDLAPLLYEPRVLGLAEMMNFPGVLAGDEEVLQKIDLFRNRVVDGHSPGLTGRDLQAYLTAGIGSDHESFALAEGREKVEAGMMLMIREGTSARNLGALLPLVNQTNWNRFCLVHDDLHAEELAERGHLDYLLRKAVGLGLDPVTAVRLVTINPAQYFGLRSRGALAPGYRADIVVADDLERFEIKAVFKDGSLVAEGGRLTAHWPASGPPGRPERPSPLRMAPFTPDRLAIAHAGGDARVIELVPGELITRALLSPVPAAQGRVQTDVANDTLKLCVFERHRESGRIGLGLVRGFGLKQGALASSVAHDSHNVIAVGVDDASIHCAVTRLREIGGGLAAAVGDRVLAELPLEVAGLMTRAPFEGLVQKIRAVKEAASELGAAVSEPFMALSFLALPVIPELKLTDRGLVDVNRFAIVPIFPAQEQEKAADTPASGADER